MKNLYKIHHYVWNDNYPLVKNEMVSNAFIGCTNLTSITVPESVTLMYA